MKKAASNEVQRGQAISFRVPSDTPDHILKHLQKLKDTERRNFSSKIAEFVMQGVSSSVSREKETITIPLPQKLTKAQRNWLKHEHSEALLGSILFQLISDPVRSTSLLASLNSHSIDIDEALYLQEEVFPEELQRDESYLQVAVGKEVPPSPIDLSDMEDDLSEFDWEIAKEKQPLIEEEENEVEPDIDDLLGGFLANMNK
ncbi:hypothetical protein SAMN05444673_0081 [Bacillus sp. OV166]|jgi:hypothetical protein|uniref:hypothetical protein n=1 Tax=unclassified Bacillus (in: firmicutes) TaxID=185979 RepID=UPI000A2AE2BC|nr:MULTISPECIES: hypothetical protein [unclassified Bacillus (in: firmicutes)]PGY12434.1 hypothetical protein COE25_08625 [Bacillus sp. AFS031507]SMQ58838.1 hypothetical protein SAMN05444673_0081 [Bacillus sp. OV166]